MNNDKKTVATTRTTITTINNNNIYDDDNNNNDKDNDYDDKEKDSYAAKSSRSKICAAAIKPLNHRPPTYRPLKCVTACNQSQTGIPNRHQRRIVMPCYLAIATTDSPGELVRNLAVP